MKIEFDRHLSDGEGEVFRGFVLNAGDDCPGESRLPLDEDGAAAAMWLIERRRAKARRVYFLPRRSVNCPHNCNEY